MIIRNGHLLLPDGIKNNCDIKLEDGRIAEIGSLDGNRDEIDASGCYVLPGLIDLHTHGIAYQSVTCPSLEEYAQIEASCGCTTFFPTLFGPPDESAEHMRRHLKATDELRLVPQVGGFRLESPYLADMGGGNSRGLAPVSNDTTDMLMQAGGGHIRIWDISPELDDAPELISYLSSTKITCSIAHTRASIQQVKQAIDAGARLVTHLFDTFTVPEMTDLGVYPAGLVDYLLVEDRITCEIIADGTHVHPLLVEKALRCKPQDKLVFITDSNLGASLPPGIYDLPEGWGKAVVEGPNNGVRLIDRDMILAGSALTPIDAFRNCIRALNRDMITASRLCSANPAKLLGLNKGEILVGRDADFIVLDESLELLHTIAAGKIIYSRTATGEAR